MGNNYRKIHSNSVGAKTDYEMFSMDFEEFLWAKGYSQEQLATLIGVKNKSISKYENGKATATEYQESKNALYKANATALQSRYIFLFRKKILDFYKGTDF